MDTAPISLLDLPAELLLAIVGKLSTLNALVCLPSGSVMYSSLTKLNVHIESFDECLAILDGRFDSLSDCSIFIPSIDSLSTGLDRMVSVVVSFARL